MARPSNHNTPRSGTTEDALALLREQDPELFEEVKGYSPVVWLAVTLSSLREAAGASQTEVAKALGTTQPTVSRLESGEVDPSFSRACQALGVLGHRLIAAPIGPEPIIVTTPSEIQKLVADSIESMMPGLQKQAMSQALVEIAGAGLGSGPAMEMSDEHSLVRAKT